MFPECRSWEEKIKATSLIFACPSKRSVLWNSCIHSNWVPVMCKLLWTPGDTEHKPFSWKTHHLPCVIKYWQIITVEGDTLHFCCSPGNNIKRKPGFVSGFDNIFKIFFWAWIKREYWELKTLASLKNWPDSIILLYTHFLFYFN